MSSPEPSAAALSLTDPGLLAVTNAAGEPLVLSQVDSDGVAVVTLNAPERANAWNEAMEAQYYAAIDGAVDDPDVRVVVLTGAGRSFCPGMDLTRLREVTQENRPYATDRRPQTLLRNVPKPVVAAVNGACAGVGLVHALMADVRFTTADAPWTASFSRIGLVAEDAVAWRLQQLCGDAVASDVLLSSRVFRGADAARWGLATAATDPAELMPTALRYARDMARRSPLSLALIKRQLVLDAAASMGEAHDRAKAYLVHVKQAPDYAEGVRAALARTEPVFPPLAAPFVPPQ